jgi:hypothetical protein
MIGGLAVALVVIVMGGTLVAALWKDDEQF